MSDSKLNATESLLEVDSPTTKKHLIGYDTTVPNVAQTLHKVESLVYWPAYPILTSYAFRLATSEACGPICSTASTTKKGDNTFMSSRMLWSPTSHTLFQLSLNTFPRVNPVSAFLHPTWNFAFDGACAVGFLRIPFALPQMLCPRFTMIGALLIVN